MKQTRILMDMPITVEVVDNGVDRKDIDEVYDYFKYIDDTFSPYKTTSKITLINQQKLKKDGWNHDIKSIFNLAEKTRKETAGFFNIFKNGICDPSGIVKGWAILNAADMLRSKKYNNFYIDAGGDIQVAGKNKEKKLWKVGIRNPFNRSENVKVLKLTDKGVATSGTYIRGQHIYNPHKPEEKIEQIVSLTVIGPNILEADRFATAAFAMGRKGIYYIENLDGFEGYMIDKKGYATYTANFNEFVYETD